MPHKGRRTFFLPQNSSQNKSSGCRLMRLCLIDNRKVIDMVKQNEVMHPLDYVQLNDKNNVPPASALCSVKFFMDWWLITLTGRVPKYSRFRKHSWSLLWVLWKDVNDPARIIWIDSRRLQRLTAQNEDEVKTEQRKPNEFLMTWNVYSLSNKSVNLNCRVGVLKATIKCIFIHKSETWTITKQTEKKINAFGTWYYRKIMLFVWKAPVCYESALISVDNCSLYAATIRTCIHENRLKILQKLKKLAEKMQNCPRVTILTIFLLKGVDSCRV